MPHRYQPQTHPFPKHSKFNKNEHVQDRYSNIFLKNEHFQDSSSKIFFNILKEPACPLKSLCRSESKKLFGNGQKLNISWRLNVFVEKKENNRREKRI